MSNEEKLLWMFKQVHGEFDSKFTLFVDFCEVTSEPDTVLVYKEGEYCWSASKVNIMFDYITKDL